MKVLPILAGLIMLSGGAFGQPAASMVSGGQPPVQDQSVAAKERATEGMLIDAMRSWQQSATDREMTMDALRNVQQQMAAKSKEASDKDAEIKKLSDQVKELETANAKLVGQAKQHATAADQK